MDFEQLAVAPAASPVWLQDFHAASRSALVGVPWPDRKTEAWRNTSLRPLTDESFNELTMTGSSDPSEYRIDDLNSRDVVFVDGQYKPELSDETPSNVNVVKLADASETEAQLIRSSLGTIVPVSQHFAQLNGSRLNDGIMLRIRGVVSQPIRIVWQSNSHGSLNHRLLVLMERGSQATLIEHFCGIGRAFTNSVSEFELSENSHLHHYRLHLEHEAAIHVGGCHARLSSNASLSGFHLGTGSPLKRLDVTVNHAGAGADSRMVGAYLPKTKQRIDYHICAEHSAPHCTSESTFRGIVADEARAVFNGRIHIHPGARETEATLDNKNLLTSHKAQVHTKPELEIYNDDVACAHGATVSQLSEESLHYLRSRGLGPDAAYRMLNFAFINELLDGASEPPLAEYLRTKLQNWFEQEAP